MRHDRLIGSLQDGKCSYARHGAFGDKCGVRKHHGHGSRTILRFLFSLAFTGDNYFREVVPTPKSPFGKDPAYNLLKGVSSNWMRFLLLMAARLHVLFKRLNHEERETVLFIDDSTYGRFRSKAVELLSKVYDHCARRYVKGFRMLTLCWSSDGTSCLPLDFALLASGDAKRRLCESRKSTDNTRAMVKRALGASIKAKYVLMDSGFTMPVDD